MLQGGNTALMYAAYNNHAPCITPLLEYGCDLTATNEDQLTAFDLAVAQGNKTGTVWSRLQSMFICASDPVRASAYSYTQDKLDQD